VQQRPEEPAARDRVQAQAARSSPAMV
jgi:hypothetical protein